MVIRFLRGGACRLVRDTNLKKGHACRVFQNVRRTYRGIYVRMYVCRNVCVYYVCTYQ